PRRDADARVSHCARRAVALGEAVDLDHGSGEHLDVDRPVTRPVELAEEDPLPGPERERAVVPQRDDDARTHQGRPNVCGSVLLPRFDVLPRPPLVDPSFDTTLARAR